MNERVTLLEVAKRAGVSISTVSRALKNDPRITAETGGKIRRLATAMGYTPDPLISQLAGKHWKTPKDHAALSIAYIYDHSEHDQQVYLHIEMANHLQQSASRYGYKVTSFNASDYPNWMALGRVMRNRGIRGVILAPIYSASAKIEMEWQHFSIVSLGPGYIPLPFHRVYSSTFEQLDRVITKVWNRGYHHIGIALFEHPYDFEDDKKRLGAAYAQKHIIESKGGKVSIISYKEQKYPEDIIIRDATLKSWFDKEKPEAIIGFNIGVYDAMIASQLTSPKDFAFATLHCDKNWPGVTGLNINTSLKADYALYMVDLLLRSNETGVPAQQTLHNVGFTWHEGNTLPDKSGTTNKQAPELYSTASYA